MGSFDKRSPSTGQRGWALLRRLGRLFRTPVAADDGSPVVSVPEAVDALPAGLRVLVADDNPLNLMEASEMLACFGVRPLLAADGAEAVAMATATRLDLILMDMQMPVLDGLGASRQIRRFERENVRARVPVVAYTSASGHWLLGDHGIDDVLEKPCEMQAMRACLRRWCLPQGGRVDPSETAASLRP